MNWSRWDYTIETAICGDQSEHSSMPKNKSDHLQCLYIVQKSAHIVDLCSSARKSSNDDADICGPQKRKLRSNQGREQRIYGRWRVISNQKVP